MPRTSPIQILSPGCQYDSKAIPVETITVTVAIDGTESRDISLIQTVNSTLGGGATATWTRDHNVFPFFTPEEFHFGWLTACCGDRSKPSFNINGGSHSFPNTATIDCDCVGAGCPGGFPKSGTPTITLVLGISQAAPSDNSNRLYILSASAAAGSISGCGFGDTLAEDGESLLFWDWQSDPMTLGELMGAHSIDINHVQAPFYTDRTANTHAHLTVTLA